MQQTSLHSWVILGTAVVATAIAVYLYRRIKPKIHDPKLHVVQRAGDSLMDEDKPVYVRADGVIYQRQNIIGYMREGDSVLIAEQNTLYKLVDGSLEFRRTFNKEIHIRIDSSTGDRYMLMAGKWRLLHLYDDNSLYRINLNTRTSFGTTAES